MLEFMMGELSAENLFFILSVLQLRAIFCQVIDGTPSTTPKDPESFVQHADKIYDAFISEESQLMVNLSADVRESMNFSFFGFLIGD